MASVMITTLAEEPQGYSSAIKSLNWPDWKKSVDRELISLVENKIWEIVGLPSQDTKTLKARWVYKVKFDTDGKPAIYKSRWVAKGYDQREGLHFEDTFAGVVKGAA
jgi:hypothetical protein